MGSVWLFGALFGALAGIAAIIGAARVKDWTTSRLGFAGLVLAILGFAHWLLIIWARLVA
ncbi:MAG: hypothetical protein FJX73_00920 [Armatimonadetes bacterium]|nr:hypothetical protein [Armatimonadota bacterium]